MPTNFQHAGSQCDQHDPPTDCHRLAATSCHSPVDVTAETLSAQRSEPMHEASMSATRPVPFAEVFDEVDEVLFVGRLKTEDLPNTSIG